MSTHFYFQVVFGLTMDCQPTIFEPPNNALTLYQVLHVKDGRYV